MIKELDISQFSENNNIPLPNLYSFVGSYAQLRIINVPKKINDWKINKLYIVVNLPDNRIETIECEKNNNVWFGNIPECEIAGKSFNGYSIEAFCDNNKYTLGKGSYFVLEKDGSIVIDDSGVYLHLLNAKPDNPNKGDIYEDDEDGIIYLYNGSEWKALNDSTTDYNDLSNKPKINDITLSGNLNLSYILSGSYYTKTETDNKLNDYVLNNDLESNYYNKNNTYSKTETNSLTSDLSNAVDYGKPYPIVIKSGSVLSLDDGSVNVIEIINDDISAYIPEKNQNKARDFTVIISIPDNSETNSITFLWQEDEEDEGRFSIIKNTDPFSNLESGKLYLFNFYEIFGSLINVTRNELEEIM